MLYFKKEIYKNARVREIRRKGKKSVVISFEKYDILRALKFNVIACNIT